MPDVGERVAPGRPAQPWFNDTGHYWYPQTPEAGTKVPQLGVKIQVRSVSPTAITFWVSDK